MAPTTNKDAYVWTWNSTYQFGDINIDALYILINSQAFKHSSIYKKSLCLFGHFRCHNSNKVFDKGLIKFFHPIKYLNLLWIHGWWMFTIACIFSGSGSFLSLKTIKPKIILENIVNAHMSGFRLMPYSFHFWKHNLNFYIWLFKSLYTVKSSKNVFIKLSKYFLNALVTTFWYVGGPFFIPNDITLHIKAP
jgi:hypothetical protein